MVEDEIVCVYEVKLISGQDRCIPMSEYKKDIEPYEIIMPVETFKFFKAFMLKACTMVSSRNSSRCSHEVKTLDRYVDRLNEISKAFL